ncbi:MAG: FAD-containing oxidoreductase, partial [Mesorhizobium sp.]
KALIATGARPRLPTIPGLADAGYLSNETMFDLTECPKRLLVIGGGPLGCEAAQAFCLLGAKVIQAQREPMFLPGEERDAAQILSDEATARMVVRNALFLGRRKLSELVIPWCTYTDPEIAHVGLYPAEARQNGIPVKTYTVLMHDVARAVMDGEEEGFVKIHVREGSDRI